MKNKKGKDQKKQKKKDSNKSNSNIMNYIDQEYSEITSKVKENLFLVCIFILVFFNDIFPI